MLKYRHKIKELFENNKYTNWYLSIIERALASDRQKLPIGHIDRIYYESHHIIPECFGGDEEVLLTAKEHFLCHMLLTKMTNEYKVKYALFGMTRKSKTHERYEITSSQYAYAKRLLAEATSIRRKGVKASEETKKLMSERRKGAGNSFYGKKHSEDTNEINRQKHLGLIQSEETRMKKSEAIKGLKRSDETKKRMSEWQKGKPKVKKEICPVCGKMMYIGNFIKYGHGPDCKQGM